MKQTVLQCKICAAMWTQQTLLEDACPECGGEVRDITHTHTGQEFLRIIEIPARFESTSLNQKTIYTTGPSSLLTPAEGWLR